MDSLADRHDKWMRVCGEDSNEAFSYIAALEAKVRELEESLDTQNSRLIRQRIEMDILKQAAGERQ